MVVKYLSQPVHVLRTWVANKCFNINYSIGIAFGYAHWERAGKDETCEPVGLRASAVSVTSVGCYDFAQVVVFDNITKNLRKSSQNSLFNFRIGNRIINSNGWLWMECYANRTSKIRRSLPPTQCTLYLTWQSRAWCAQSSGVHSQL